MLETGPHGTQAKPSSAGGDCFPPPGLGGDCFPLPGLGVDPFPLPGLGVVVFPPDSWGGVDGSPLGRLGVDSFPPGTVPVDRWGGVGFSTLEVGVPGFTVDGLDGEGVGERDPPHPAINDIVRRRAKMPAKFRRGQFRIACPRCTTIRVQGRRSATS